MFTASIISISFVFLISTCCFWLRLYSKLKSIPGPPRLPLFGNLLNWPSEFQADRIQEWKEVYGSMIKLVIIGKVVIFLTTPRVISELFAKRASRYADRPRLVFSQELCGLSSLHPMTQYGPEFSQQRRFMKEVLGIDVLRKHESLLDEEGSRLLQAIYSTPIEFDRHLRRFSSSLSLRLVYGFEAMDIDDPHILLAEEMMQLSEYAVIAGWLVDFFPSLRYLPKWLPGAGFKKRAEYYRHKVHEMISVPFEEVRQQVSTGTARDSFCSINMQRTAERLSMYDEELIKTTATAIYGGGSDTTASAAWSFMLAMVINQDAQFKAQQEIDLVTGRSRLPRMSDQAAMPYLTSIVWETFRWSPPVPVTLPHRAREDDEIDGFSVKKDNVLIASLWSVTRDEEYHKNAQEFDPDRYFDRKERTPYYVFGYGHRRCPGADMAFAQLFHQAAFILSVFEIRPELDVGGSPLWPKAEFVGEMVRHPKPFRCVITPRWKEANLLFQSQ